MPYVSPQLLSQALASLPGHSPLVVLVIPAMLRAHVPVTNDPAQGALYGAAHENTILEEFFSVPGAPADRPFAMVWQDDLAGRSTIRRRSLQRQRRDRANRGFRIRADEGRRPALTSGPSERRRLRSFARRASIRYRSWTSLFGMAGCEMSPISRRSSAGSLKSSSSRMRLIFGMPYYGSAVPKNTRRSRWRPYQSVRATYRSCLASPNLLPRWGVIWQSFS